MRRRFLENLVAAFRFDDFAYQSYEPLADFTRILAGPWVHALTEGPSVNSGTLQSPLLATEIHQATRVPQIHSEAVHCPSTSDGTHSDSWGKMVRMAIMPRSGMKKTASSRSTSSTGTAPMSATTNRDMPNGGVSNPIIRL